MQGNSFESRDWLGAFLAKTTEKKSSQQSSSITAKIKRFLTWSITGNFLHLISISHGCQIYCLPITKSKSFRSSPRNRLCNVIATSWNKLQVASSHMFRWKTVSGGLLIGNVKRNKKAENGCRIWSVFNGKGRRKLTSLLMNGVATNVSLTSSTQNLCTSDFWSRSSPTCG